MRCLRCNGTGKEPNQKRLGKQARENRIAAKKTVQALADLMGLSISYISDLELGKRNWNTDLIKRFNAAIKSK